MLQLKRIYLVLEVHSKGQLKKYFLNYWMDLVNTL